MSAVVDMSGRCHHSHQGTAVADVAAQSPAMAEYCSHHSFRVDFSGCVGNMLPAHTQPASATLV